jgi:carboxypeptidase Taq
MEHVFDELKRSLMEVQDLRIAAGLMSWDQQTMMPPRGAATRAEHLATLSRLAHERFIAPRIGDLLERLTSYEASLPPESDDASLIRVARRDYEKQCKVPAELAEEQARAASQARVAWIEARRNADFAIFLPYLERNVELLLEYAACFPEHADPYDALLDDYESGLTATEVETVFNRLKEVQPALVAHVTAHQDAVDDAVFWGHFPAEQQRTLSIAIIEHFGFDPEGWRLDIAPHPFASKTSTTDIRLTTRYNESHLAESLFAGMHECGHGLYEAGVSPTLERTLLSRGCSLSLHESQSRLWENLVGRSRPFWTFALPIVRSVFPDQFGAVDEETVYRAANKMHPSLIRVEADELTYNLHIILRFELEREMIHGRLALRDLPEAWNAKMEQYLGLTPPDDAHGVLQDIHWSGGGFGYFPTYALGNLISVQIWDRLQDDLPDLTEQMSRGEFAPLRTWLGERLHQHGRKFTPRETLQKVAGGPLDPEPYLRYLTAKVQSLYGPIR